MERHIVSVAISRSCPALHAVDALNQLQASNNFATRNLVTRKPSLFYILYFHARTVTTIVAA
jgi:hypothetical protein